MRCHPAGVPGSTIRSVSAVSCQSRSVSLAATPARPRPAHRRR
jgi:hypothetical protein